MPEKCHWDFVVLTSRNASQKELFELELERIRLQQKFCAKFLVIEDTPPNAKIGSGGATLNVLHFLYQNFGGNSFFANNRVLILHSGGLSQRIFHVALIGKAFMLMPDGRALLEHKLLSYQNFRPLLRALSSRPGFVFIASSDVLEHFPGDFSLQSSQLQATLLLIAHQSTIEVAEQHGVYVLNNAKKLDYRLKRVLQKPRREAIRQLGAVFEQKNGEELALTDSCYLIGPTLVLELVKMKEQMANAELAEICCYRDFLGPLGNGVEAERKIHFCANVPTLLEWQTALWDLMHSKETQMVDLGPQSFFHFGTPNELLDHFFGSVSIFRAKFLAKNECGNVLNSEVKQKDKISGKSLMEWCKFEGNCEIGEGCILSGLVHKGKEVRIGEGFCASTFPLKKQEKGEKQDDLSGYVTVAFHRDDDLKQTSANSLQWFGHKMDVPTSLAPLSLWDMPLFPIRPTRHESLRATLNAIESPQTEILGKDGNGADKRDLLLSISEVLNRTDAKRVLNWRKSFS